MRRRAAATCLLGIRHHFSQANLSAPVDWFQIVRMSTLKHLSVTRTEARKGNHVGAQTIKERVARDLVSRIQLRAATEKPLGCLKWEAMLREAARKKKRTDVRASDFENIADW